MMQPKYVKYSQDGKLLLPNIKRIFIPDEGYELADADLCLTEDHEILTINGWENLKDYVETKSTVPVAQWDKGIIKFLPVLDHVKINYSGELHTLEGKLNLKGSSNHKQPYYYTHTKSYLNKPLKEIVDWKLSSTTTRYKFIHAGHTCNSSPYDVSPAYLQLLVAMQADGCFTDVRKQNSHIRFNFSKQRKVRRTFNIHT